MNSIRRRLTAGLLGSLAILWILAGSGTYLSVSRGLVKSIDTELALDAQVLRFVARGDQEDTLPEDAPLLSEERGRRGGAIRRIQARISGYDQTDSGYYYQSWDATGETIAKSPSLAEGNLPLPEIDGDTPEFDTVTLDDGTRLRVMAFQNTAGGRGRSKGERRRGEGATLVAVARDLESVSQSLSTVLGGMVLLGALIAGASALLVGFLVKRSLRPLDELGDRSRGIDATSLDSRFPVENVPSELVPVYECLNDLLSRIETSFDRERRFSSDLAHEMRTPVAELRMISESALKWPDQSGEKTHRESLEIAEQLESMIQNLLKLARWESGEVEVETRAVPLIPLIEASWKRQAESAARRNLELIIEDASGPDPETDPAFLTHLLDNLVSNAVEYSDPDTPIHVRIEDEGFEISNTASQLGEAEVAQFFDRYWRGDTSRGSSGHAGLGLSLARACAEALGAALDARLDGERVVLSLRWNSPRKRNSPTSS